ncbi:hypothetical protein [Thalassobaculum sp.]|uniref:hypothetical protein n=1 Tax=Thalassobaculum sp. TaxID=2022740 RepID=UPI0032EDAB64
MRWVLFDLVVGAALVWLLWGDRADLPEGAAPSTTVAMDPSSANAGQTIVLPAEPVDPAPAPSPVMAPPPVTPAVTADDRGRRLRALVRDAEALLLRTGGER